MWTKLGFFYLSSLFHPQSRRLLTKGELAASIKEADRSLSRQRINSLATRLAYFTTLIPDKVLDFIAKTAHSFSPLTRRSGSDY